jgi:hypothetical protein
LNTVVKETKVNSSTAQFRVRTTNLEGNLVLINYLYNFPLFSSKYLNYKDWVSVLEFFKVKTHTNAKSIKEIIIIKSKMNDKRVEFNWDHLLKFYSLYK